MEKFNFKVDFVNEYRIRYRQLDYSMNEYKDKLRNCDIPYMGCCPTLIATILTNYGIKKDPIEIVKKIIIDKEGKFDDTYLKTKGIRHEGLIYCLDRLINEEKLNIEYEIVKISFNNPKEQKQKIIDNVKNGIKHINAIDFFLSDDKKMNFKFMNIIFLLILLRI